VPCDLAPADPIDGNVCGYELKASLGAASELPDRERRSIVALPASPHAGPKFGGKYPRCRCQFIKGEPAGEKAPR
jgi:hypothetical protein